MDYFTESNLRSLRYQQSTIDRLTVKYPPFSGVEITSYRKISDSRIAVTLPPLSNFNIGNIIAIITKNGSGYYSDTSITVVDLPSPTPTPSITPTPTPALANCIIITGVGNEYIVSGDYTLTYSGTITYTLAINGVDYNVTDNIVQYTNTTNSLAQFTLLPSLNGWYLQAPNVLNQQLNVAYLGNGISYNVTTGATILTGGGSVSIALNPGCANVNVTPTPTPTASITPTVTPSFTPTATPTPTPSN